MPEPTLIAVGHRLALRDDALEDLGPAQAPRNYKDPEKIAAAVEEKTQKLRAQLNRRKLTGRVERIVAYDACESRYFDSATVKEPPGAAFVAWLRRQYAFPTYPRADEDPEVAFYGFGVADCVRVAGFEATLADPTMPIGLWYGNYACYDPYEMIVESEIRDVVPASKVLVRLGIAEPAAPFLVDYAPHIDPALDCRFALEICAALGLVSREDPGAMWAAAREAHSKTNGKKTRQKAAAV